MSKGSWECKHGHIVTKDWPCRECDKEKQGE